MSVDPNNAPEPLNLEADDVLDDGPLTFNGVNGSTGAYLFPRLTVSELARLVAAQDSDDPAHLADLRERLRRREASF